MNRVVALAKTGKIKTFMARTPKSVTEYIKSLPPKVSKTLGQVQKAVNSAAPDAEELIRYRIPYYKHNGALIAFMAFKNHCSFVTMSHNIVKTMQKELKSYDVSGTTIHFPLDKPLPAALVKKIVKARMKENDAAWKKKRFSYK